MSYARTVDKLRSAGSQSSHQANPSTSDSLEIDVSSYNKLMEEYAQLQQVSDTLPNSVRPAAQETPKAGPDITASFAAPGSLVHDALMILDKLEQKAMQLAAITDIEEPYLDCTLDEFKRLKKQYENTHKVSLSAAEADLSERRFDAACDLVEITLIRYPQFTNVCPELKRQLEYHFDHTYAGIEIQASHTIEYIKERHYDYGTMPAPVSRLPFASGRKWLTDMLDLLLSGWETNPAHKDALARIFAYEGNRQTVGRLLLLLEKTLQRIGTFRFEKDAALNGISEHVITISPKSLEQAKEFLFTDNAARLEARSANISQRVASPAVFYPQEPIAMGCPACGMMSFAPATYKR